ncbi:glycosyltransferase family 4 protein [Roseomonas gilardii]|uniref:glycosyltransferase family 4 protein n=1 Tax=Roseomonas gilardii TaxID=257708 RepID=UPI0011A30F2F|nr:glycosyltransferase family 4 protein [Roseomonas gilardii]
MTQRIFQVGSGWFPEHKGGAENVFYNLYLGLEKLGFESRGIVPGKGQAEIDTQGRFRSFPADASMLSRARAIRAAAGELLQARPVLATSHFALYTLPILDKLRALPLVVHFHGPWALESAAEGASSHSVRVKKLIETVVYRRAQRVIVLSEAFGRIAQEHYGVRDSALRLVQGGADLATFTAQGSRAEARARMGWVQDRPVLLAVRRLVRRMGLDRLIEAMAALRQKQVDAVLYIVGKGPERLALEELVRRHGLEDTVRFAGFVPDELLPVAYRAADLVVVPTAALEGFGLIAVEALASGTPVLVTPVGGLPEVVSGLSPDLVLPGSDADSIASGLAAALTTPGRLPDEAACRRYAEDHFAWPVISEKVAAVYRELI